MTTDNAGTAAFQNEVNSQNSNVRQPNLIRGVDVVNLPGGKTFSIGPQPYADPQYEAPVMDAIASLVAIHGAVQGTAADRHLSDIGKREKVAAQSAQHIQVIAKQAAKIDTLSAAADAREADHYTPASLPPSNAAAAVTDGQIRSQFHAMTPGAQADVLMKVRTGNLPAVADALTRDPFGPSEATTSAWKSGMDVRAPAERVEIDADRENGRWAALAVKRVADAAVPASGMKRHEILSALGAAHPGAAVFGIGKFEKPANNA